MTHGYTNPLHVLAFDHRTAFTDRLPSAADRETIVAAKGVIFYGILRALDDGVPTQTAGIIVDEEYGAEIARAARARGNSFAMPVEVWGGSEFDFAYGDEFAQHLDAFAPTFAKALTRYDPDGAAEVNARQAERLALLTTALERGQTKLMLEVVVPDGEPRSELMVRAVEELPAAGVDPDIWKVDALAEVAQCARIVETCRSGGRDDIGVIVLARGAAEDRLLSALRAAAATDGYIGFAVGRTIWGSRCSATCRARRTRRRRPTKSRRRTRGSSSCSTKRARKTPKPADLSVLGLRLGDYVTRRRALSSQSV